MSDSNTGRKTVPRKKLIKKDVTGASSASYVAPRSTATGNAGEAAEKPREVERETIDLSRSPLEVIFEATEERGRPTTLSSFSCTDRMLAALSQLQGDKENSSVALETIASVSMRVIGDAEAVTKMYSEKKIKGPGFLIVQHELSNMATIFVRNQAFEDIYDAICVAIKNLSIARHGEAQLW